MLAIAIMSQIHCCLYVDGLNNKNIPSHAQQDAFPQQFHHHDHKTVVINKVQNTVTSESAQEQLSLDAASKPFKM